MLVCFRFLLFFAAFTCTSCQIQAVTSYAIKDLQVYFDNHLPDYIEDPGYIVASVLNENGLVAGDYGRGGG